MATNKVNMNALIGDFGSVQLSGMPKLMMASVGPSHIMGTSTKCPRCRDEISKGLLETNIVCESLWEGKNDEELAVCMSVLSDNADQFNWFNTNIINRQIPYTFTFKSVGPKEKPLWYCWLRIADGEYVGSWYGGPDYHKIDAKADAIRQMRDKIPPVSNNQKMRELFEPCRRSAVPEMNAVGVNSTGPMTNLRYDRASKTVLISQRDQSITYDMSKPSNIPRPISSYGDVANAFPSLCERWTCFGIKSWSITDPQYRVLERIDVPIDPLLEMPGNPSLSQFKQYAFVRPNMTLKLQSNSSRFHQGKLIIGLRYGSIYDSSEEPLEFAHAAKLVQMHHVMLSASESNIAEIKIPYISQYDMIPTGNTEFAAPLYICSVYVGILAPLRTGDANTPAITYTKFIKFSCDGVPTEFFGQRYFKDPFVVDTLRRPAQPQGNRKIPIDPIAMQPWSGPQLSVGFGPQYVRTLRLDPTATATHPTATVPQEYNSHFKFNYLKRIWGFLRSVTINAETLTPGEEICHFRCTPIGGYAITDGTDSGTYLLNTPISLLANYFSYWCGDLELRIMAVKTPIHSFRLAVGVCPDGEPPSFYDRESLPHCVLDFQEGDCFDITIPYMSNMRVAPIARTISNNPNQDEARGNTIVLYYGRVYIWLESSIITMESLSQNIDLLFFVRGAPNFSLHVPSESMLWEATTTVVDARRKKKSVPVVGGPMRSLAVAEGSGMSNMIVNHVMPDARPEFKTEIAEESASKVWDTIGALEGLADMFGPEAAAVAQTGIGIFEKVEPRPVVEEIVEELPVTPPETGKMIGGPDGCRDPEKARAASAKTKGGSSGMGSLGMMPGAAKPEMEERTSSEASGSFVHSDRSYGGILHFGECASVAAMCKRSNLVLADRFNIGFSTGVVDLTSETGPSVSYETVANKVRVWFEYDMNAGTPYIRREGDRVNFQHALHDSFRFFRGSQRYQLVVNANKNVLATVFHFPHAEDVRTNLNYGVTDNLHVGDYGINLAKEVLASNQQNIIPYEIPYSQPTNFLVNRFDPDLFNRLGASVYASGFVRVVFDIQTDGIANGDVSVDWQLFQSMSDDGELYTYQGPPWYAAPYLLTNQFWDNDLQGGVSSESVNESGPIPTINQWLAEKKPVKKAMPEMDEHYQVNGHDVSCPWSDPQTQCGPDTCACCFNKETSNSDQPLNYTFYKLSDCIEKLLQDNFVPNRAYYITLLRRVRLLERKLKRKKLIPEMMNSDVVKDAIDGAIAAGGLTSQTGLTALGVASSIPGISYIGKPLLTGAATHKLAGIADQASGLLGQASSFFSSLPNMFSDAISGLASTFGNVLSSAGINFGSAFAHLYGMLKAPQLDLKLSSLVGFLCAIGVLTMDLFYKAFELVSSFVGFRNVPYAIPEGDDESNPCVAWYSLLFGGIVALLGVSSNKSNNLFVSFKDGIKDFFFVANHASNFISKQFDYIKECIYWLVGWQHPEVEAVKKLNLANINLEEWATEVLAMSGAFEKKQVLSDPMKQLKVCTLKEEGDLIITQAKHFDAAKFRALGMVYKRISEMYDSVGLKASKYGKIEPVSIWVSGKPGIGKSAIAKRLAIDVCQELGIVHDGDPCYTRNPADPYWSDYLNQPIVVFDDFGSIREPQIQASMCQDFMVVNSPVAYAPRFAEVRDKGTVVAPAVLITNSNESHPTPNMVKNVDALWRRRDIVLNAKFAAWLEFKHPGIKNLKDGRLDASDWEKIGKMQHLVFDVLDETIHDKVIEANIGAHEIYTKYFPKLMLLYKHRKAHCEDQAELDGRLSVKAWVARGRDGAAPMSLRETIECNLRVEVPPPVPQAPIMTESLLNPDAAEFVPPIVDMFDSIDPKDIEIAFGPTGLVPVKRKKAEIVNKATPNCGKGECELDSCAKKYLSCGCTGIYVSNSALQTNFGEKNYNGVTKFAKYLMKTLNLKTASELISECYHKILTPDNDYCGEHQAFTYQWEMEVVTIDSQKCCDTCIFSDPIDGKIWFEQFFEEAIKRKQVNTWRMIEMSDYVIPDSCRPSVSANFLPIMETIKGAWEWMKSLCLDIVSYIPTCLSIILAVIGVGTFIWRLYKLFVPDEVAKSAWNATLGPITDGISGLMAKVGSELHHSDGLQTSKAASRYEKLIGKLATPQGGFDIANVVYRNTVHMYGYDEGKEGNWTLSITGLGVRGRTALIPYHFLNRYRNRPNDYVKIVYNGKYDVGGILHVPMSSIKVHRIEGCDMAAVDFPKKCPMFRNILHLLVDEDAIKRVGRSGLIVHTPVAPMNQQRLIELQIERTIEQFYYGAQHGEEEMDVNLLGWTYPWHGVGKCGSVLVDPTHQRILAMHVAGALNTAHSEDYGYAQCIPTLVFRDYDFGDSPLDFDESTLSKDIPLVCPSGDYVPIGKLAREECMVMPCKTAIVKAETYGVLGEPSRVPVNFKTEGEPVPGVTKLEAALSKGTHPTKGFPTNHLETMKTWLSDELLTTCAPVCQVENVRSFQDALYGVPGVPFMDSMNMNSSPGYPLNVHHKGKKKHYFVENHKKPDGSLVLDGLHKDLEQLYRENHAKRVKNILPESPYFNFLKDERLKPGKSPRLIQGCAFDETIEWRRYCLDFFAAYQSAGRDVSCGIGMNVRAMDTTDLVQRLLAVSPKILTLDYKDFGPGLDSEIVMILCDIVCGWYIKYAGDIPAVHRANTVRRCLFEGLAHARHVAFDAMILSLCGSPSGNPWTAPINTFVNKAYIVLAWLGIFANNAVLRTHVAFRKLFYMCAYGDDIIAAVAVSISDRFNNETISQYLRQFGIIVTDATDKEGNMRPHCTIEEATFLKHFFRPHDVRSGLWLAALEKQTITDIPSWIRTPCPDPREQALINSDQAVRFAYSWGPDYYEHVVKDLKSYWDAKKVLFTPPSWDDVDAQCFDIVKGPGQLAEDIAYLDQLLTRQSIF